MLLLYQVYYILQHAVEFIRKAPVPRAKRWDFVSDRKLLFIKHINQTLRKVSSKQW
jgi:hypothetical protein